MPNNFWQSGKWFKVKSIWARFSRTAKKLASTVNVNANKMASSTSTTTPPLKIPSKKTSLPAPPVSPGRPFPRRLVPFRHPDFTDDQIQRLTDNSLSSKDRLLRTLKKLEVTPSLLSAPGSNPDGLLGPNVTPVSPGSVPSDGELLSAMMTRLVWLETKLSEGHRQLQEKEKIITQLEEQISILNQARAAYEGNPIQDLEETCLHLQNHIHQMEQFLTDCGLMWNIGTNYNNYKTPEVPAVNICPDEPTFLETGAYQHPDLHSPGGSNPSVILSSEPFKLDYDLIIENIQDLNVLAGEGVPQICLSPEGAKFKLVDHVPLALYSNGIALCGGQFRPLTDQATKQCLQDLMDGYFPSELQRRYPNGVPLKVIDKRQLEFMDHSSISGPGKCGVKTVTVPSSRTPVLSSATSQSPTGLPSAVTSPSTATEMPVCHVSIQQLLNALPKSVVRDGRLMDVRHSINQLLKGSIYNLDIIVVQTPVVQQLREGRTSGTSVTTLRIRSESGNETYLMKLYTTDRVADIRKYLDLHRAGTTSDYDIVALYPGRVFNKPDDTLEECGLVPNAALYLHQVSKSEDSPLFGQQPNLPVF